MCDINMPKQTQKEYQKRLEKLNWLIEREFIPSELKKITGLSRRQIAEWDKKGILLSKKRKSSDTWSWRKFTGANIIYLSILSELRKAGLSPADFIDLVYWFRDFEEGMIKKIKTHIAKGNNIFIRTDLHDRFSLISETERKEDYVLILGQKDYEYGKNKITLQININSIIHDIFRKINEKPIDAK